MPKNLSLMKSLKKKYWAKAEEVYYGMESSGNPATKTKAIAKSKKDHPSWYKKETNKVVKKIVKSITKKKKTIKSK